MPEHVHVLIWPRRHEYSISAILKTLKQSVARVALVHLRDTRSHAMHLLEDRQPNGKVSCRFWQRGGGYDRNLMEPATMLAEIDYIHANPVRRGLCERPIEWACSSARGYVRAGSGMLRLNLESLPMSVDG
ncbi:hypothetical protein Mal4_11480 [Maioricimonas rarisocia]|uniref:Transposase IS200 like protein n=2 Tax=Maioricimonas rarisocia TaxID=2528026 RepID=A0A517Z316_9PLAN|nr:hypothetical protein Mal4_11480 [Maioricimonas rarisocia]